jgi:hypothetical protein
VKDQKSILALFVGLAAVKVHVYREGLITVELRLELFHRFLGDK